jgi:hypothetical protein
MSKSLKLNSLRRKMGKMSDAKVIGIISGIAAIVITIAILVMNETLTN